MSDISFRIQNLSKAYKITRARKGLKAVHYKTLQQDLLALPGKVFSSLRGRTSADRETVWALKNVTFDVREGEAVGIIGRNGAGKSTLLKILSRITDPTEGRAEVYGRVGSLLEVGTGFHPELTGRENIFLNGAIIGMQRSEITRKFDDIVAFSEVEQYIDTPVKFYSSGMYVRLAFAVAAHLEPEILIVDEVLAVGDAQFQKKCLGKMGEVANQGRTVLFVTHNMSVAAQLCSRGILLNKGKVISDGPMEQVIDAYMRITANENLTEKLFPAREDGAAHFTRFCLKNDKGEQTRIFANSEDIVFEVEYDVNRPLSNNHLHLLIERADGLLIIKSADDDGGQVLNPARTPGKYQTTIRFPGRLLNEGVYQFRVVLGKRRGEKHDHQEGFTFEVEDWNDYTESSFGKRNGALLFPLSWSETKI